MRCGICQNEPPEELRHLPLYVNGSEGIDVCWGCAMFLTETIRQLRSTCSRSRLAYARERKRKFREYIAESKKEGGE
jgi:hypothetical protein